MVQDRLAISCNGQFLDSVEMLSVPYVLALLACASCGSSPVNVASSPLGAHWVDVLQSLAQTGLDSTAIDESVLEMLPSSDVKVSYQVRTPQRVHCTSCDHFFASGCRAGLGTTAGTSACSTVLCRTMSKRSTRTSRRLLRRSSPTRRRKRLRPEARASVLGRQPRVAAGQRSISWT